MFQKQIENSTFGLGLKMWSSTGFSFAEWSSESNENGNRLGLLASVSSDSSVMSWRWGGTLRSSKSVPCKPHNKYSTEPESRIDSSTSDVGATSRFLRRLPIRRTFTRVRLIFPAGSGMCLATCGALALGCFSTTLCKLEDFLPK